MAFNAFGKKKDEPIDDERKLLCTEPGCGRRWTVDLGRPMCSYHQWSNQKPATMRDISNLLPSETKEPQWYDRDAF